MIDLTVRVHDLELLDAPSHEPGSLYRSLDDLIGVNRWLGGSRVVLHHLTRLTNGSTLRVLDVGTGAGDIPRRICRIFQRRGVAVQVLAVDRQTLAARFAGRACRGVESIAVATADGLQLPLADRTVDVAIASSTLHHFDDPAAVALLREMGRVASRAVLINDLERHRLNYLGARVLGETWWRRSYARLDAPLSVRRGFRGSELRTLAQHAGLRHVRVHRHLPFRLAMIGSPPG